jgi:hypothetical protein
VQWIVGGGAQQQGRRQGPDQAPANITGESVGAAQEYCRSPVARVLVIGMLLTETPGWEADRIRLVGDVMVRPSRHEGQVTRPKLQRSSRIFEP